jgi:hypothetical protein
MDVEVDISVDSAGVAQASEPLRMARTG